MQKTSREPQKKSEVDSSPKPGIGSNLYNFLTESARKFTSGIKDNIPVSSTEHPSESSVTEVIKDIKAATSYDFKNSDVRPVEEVDGNSEQVLGSNISDQPSIKDKLGFEPYVVALAQFLKNENTLGPLTVSVEGEWGSGKSSFMLQLAEELKKPENTISGKIPFIIQFNAWRYDKEDAMWAAFALELIKGLAKQTSTWNRTKAKIWLLVSRYDWNKGGLRFVLFCFSLTLSLFFLAILGYLLLTHSSSDILGAFLNKDASLEKVLNVAAFSGGLLSSLIIGVAIIVKFKKILINPLAVDLRRHLESPDYKGRNSFIEDFHKDFKNIVTAYAGKGTETRRVFVFIDDLDRCEVPKSADLMQALNLMISDSPQLFFIIGMDREKVAAGLAVKHEKILPYIVAGGESGQIGAYNAFTGLEYGYAFIEKFVQVPFKVPQPSSVDINRLINDLNVEEENKISLGNLDDDTAQDFMVVKLERDSQVVRNTVEMVAATFDFNPRRIKQFLNLFRLKAYIAGQTGLFTSTANLKNSLTFEKLGKFVALTLKYPLLIADLEDSPYLLSTLQYVAWFEMHGNKTLEFSFPDEIGKRWATKTKLLELLKKGFENSELVTINGCPQPKDEDSQKRKFSMTELDISKLLQVSPVKRRIANQIYIV